MRTHYLLHYFILLVLAQFQESSYAFQLVSSSLCLNSRFSSSTINIENHKICSIYWFIASWGFSSSSTSIVEGLNFNIFVGFLSLFFNCSHLLQVPSNTCLWFSPLLLNSFIIWIVVFVDYSISYYIIHYEVIKQQNKQ